MSDYQNLDLRSPETRSVDRSPFRGILYTLGVVLVLFVLLAALGSGTRDGDPTVPPGVEQQSAPAGEEQQTAPAVTTQPAGE